METLSIEKLIEVAERFNMNGPVVAVEEYGTGNVNDTYLVTREGLGADRYFILQRINQHVFRQPKLIMVNMRVLTDHVQVRLARERQTTEVWRRWDVPRVFATHDGQDYLVGENQEFWRAMSFVGQSKAYPQIQSAEHAFEAGYALGRFQSLISDLRIEQLHDTLVGFHITPRYLHRYDRVIAGNHKNGASTDTRYCMSFIDAHRGSASVLEDSKASGKLPLRPTHGDPKIDNIMIDETTRQAVSIIDLDTVKPGLVHYDIGDCLRSCCNALGEETDDIMHVRFEMDLCSQILRGYLSIARCFFNRPDYDYLYDAIRIIAFELGVRFFTDHLEGNVYFKARHPEQNLHRALVQFRLAESIEAQENRIRALVAELR